MGHVTTEGPDLMKKSIDLDSETLVVVTKKPDDPMCLRVSLGGQIGAYYCVYRGDEAEIEVLLVAALEAFRKSRAG